MYTINLNILFEDKEPFIQINYYIDTPNFTLRDHKSALRIRVKTTHMK